jgi:hypothetical protein
VGHRPGRVNLTLVRGDEGHQVTQCPLRAEHFPCSFSKKRRDSFLGRADRRTAWTWPASLYTRQVRQAAQRVGGSTHVFVVVQGEVTAIGNMTSLLRIAAALRSRGGLTELNHGHDHFGSSAVGR